MRDKVDVAWGRLRRLPPLAWAGPLVFLVLIGVFAVWFSKYWKPPLAPEATATALAEVTKPSLTPSNIAPLLPISPVITPTATLTLTPTPSSTQTATPTQTPTGTSTPTPVTLTVTRTPTKMPTPAWTPARTQLELVAPLPGSGPYCNPITFKWHGSLSTGQTYRVMLRKIIGLGWPDYVIQSGLLTTQSWTVNLPASDPDHAFIGLQGEWWGTVSVVMGGNVVFTTPKQQFIFDPLGKPQPLTP